MICLGTTRQKAAKKHRCENCGRFIESGQTYVRQRMVDGGEAWVWKSHEDCQEASQILFDEVGANFDDGLPLVSEMDSEDRDVVRRVNPALAERMWPTVSKGPSHDK